MLSPKHNMWYGWLKEELNKLKVEALAPDYPDSWLCRAEYWLPFIKSIGADENTILVGHSTGAIAAMRFAEENKILGTVLVAGYYTDLEDPEEKESGYFNTPWQWEKIKENQKWIVQFHSTDDPWIPTEEAHMIHKKLQTELHEFNNRGHFGVDGPKHDFPELFEELRKKLSVE